MLSANSWPFFLQDFDWCWQSVRHMFKYAVVCSKQPILELKLSYAQFSSSNPKLRNKIFEKESFCPSIIPSSRFQKCISIPMAMLTKGICLRNSNHPPTFSYCIFEIFTFHKYFRTDWLTLSLFRWKTNWPTIPIDRQTVEMMLSRNNNNFNISNNINNFQWTS